MCKEFEEKLRKSFGGQVRVNPEGDLGDGEVFICLCELMSLFDLDDCALIKVSSKYGEKTLCRFKITEDWQKWDDLIALIKSAVRLYREE